jgi:hypothetical protein
MSTQQERQDRMVKAYLDMEQQIHDVANMAFAACLLIELFQEQFRSMSKMSCSADDLVKHCDQWLYAADFSVQHVSEMAKALKAHYAAHPN